MRIRNANMDDLDRLAELEAASYPTAEGASRESIEGRLRYYPDHFWLLELDDGKTAAFIIFRQFSLRLSSAKPEAELPLKDI